MLRRFAELIGCDEHDLKPPSEPVCTCDLQVSA
jgi:hypothetical protein